MFEESKRGRIWPKWYLVHWQVVQLVRLPAIPSTSSDRWTNGSSGCRACPASCRTGTRTGADPRRHCRRNPGTRSGYYDNEKYVRSLHSIVGIVYHIHLLLKLDTKLSCHSLVQLGICTAPHPLQVLCLVHCKKWPIDAGTNLFV